MDMHNIRVIHCPIPFPPHLLFESYIKHMPSNSILRSLRQSHETTMIKQTDEIYKKF